MVSWDRNNRKKDAGHTMQQVSNSVSSETLKEATNTWTIAKDMGVRYEAEEGKMVSKIAILEGKNRGAVERLGRSMDD